MTTITIPIGHNISITGDHFNYQPITNNYADLDEEYYEFSEGELELGLIPDNMGAFQVRVYDAITEIGVINPTITITDDYSNTWTETPDNTLADFVVYMDRELNITVSATGYTTQTRTTTIDEIIDDPEIFYLIGSTTPDDPTLTYALFTAIDQDTREGIPGAQIQLSDGRSTQTGFSGVATMTVNKTQTYAYTAYKAGYSRITGSFEISESTEIRILMDPTGSTIPSEINSTYIQAYTDNINDTFTDFRTTFNQNLNNSFGIFDNFTSQINYVTEQTTSANGTISESVGIITMMGTMINCIPGKVQFLITYYLICLLGLMIFNR